MGQSTHSDPDIGAARLQLFSLLSAVEKSSSVRQDRVVMEPHTPPVFYDDAVDLMAHLPKPTVCLAHLDRDTLVVNCRALAELPPREREILTVGGFGPGPLLDFVGEHHSGEIGLLPVWCAGRGHLELTVADVERWYRDYRMPFRDSIAGTLRPGYGVSDAFDITRYTDPVWADVRSHNAVALLRFYSLDDEDAGSFTGFTFSPDDTLTPEQESSLVKLATTFAMLPDSVQLSSPFGDSLPHLAAVMRRRWEGREMPLGVDAFIKRFGAPE